ncbi:WXG100 family type VII secretion target [Nocardia gipuzkoensis]
MTVMLYNVAQVEQLCTDLRKYRTDIQTEKDTADTAAKNLLGNAWQSEASTAFEGKHKSLMSNMGDLLVTLDKGIAAIEEALRHAKATDGSIYDDFQF